MILSFSALGVFSVPCVNLNVAAIMRLTVTSVVVSEICFPFFAFSSPDAMASVFSKCRLLAS